MREWSELEMSFTAGGFLSPSDGFCSAEQQFQYYDVLAEPLGFPLQEPDLQFFPYSQQQYNQINVPFSIYGSSPSSTSSPSSSSSSSSSSQPYHLPYHYSPYCLEPLCEPVPEPPCDGPVQGRGAAVLPLGRRARTVLGGKSRGQDELCVVCGDKASGYHYNALTCEGCKGFFRRSVTKKAVYHCKSGGGCEMDMYMRRKCQDCRLRKCRAVGMLAECLLTEVQCQSKRLRKGGKGHGREEEKEEEEVQQQGGGSRRCSSSSRLPAQVSSSGLTQEQRYAVDRMVEAHRLYRAEDSSSSSSYSSSSHSSSSSRVFEWSYTEEGEADLASTHIQRLLQFAKTVPGFDLLDICDQSCLLSLASLEVTFLLSAQHFGQNPTSSGPALQLFNASTHAWLRNAASKEHGRTSGGSSQDLLGPVRSFFQSMATLRVTEAEYTLLAATVLLCSDRAPLQAARCVEKLQEVVLDLLSRVCRAPGGAARGGPQRFGRLLGRLTELRTLHHNYLLLTRRQPALLMEGT